jgi:uncharacterized ferritin-like protein (DUF455 family)
MPTAFSEQPQELRRGALATLVEADPQTKVRLTHALLARAGDMTLDTEALLQAPTALPGRPDKPELRPHLDIPKRSPFTEEGLAALLHAVTHIEFNAINLALDAIWRFPGMPHAYYFDWLKVADEEALHFSLLQERLRAMGRDYGDFPAHTGLWDMTDRTREDVLARMALVPRTLEARGLDATPPMQAKLRRVGSPHALAAVKVLDVILRDEIGHVAVGNHWYAYLCAMRNLEPIDTYAVLAKTYGAPRIKGPLNLQARRLAGFSEAELQRLEAHRRPHARPDGGRGARLLPGSPVASDTGWWTQMLRRAKSLASTRRSATPSRSSSTTTSRTISMRCGWIRGASIPAPTTASPADMSLAQAQEAKLDHICRKLMLRRRRALPGHRRRLGRAAAVGGRTLRRGRHRHHAVEEPACLRQRPDRGEGPAGPRAHAAARLPRPPERRSFDKIASVGMFEHVGQANMPAYFGKIHRLLKPGGLVMNHGITAGSLQPGPAGRRHGRLHRQVHLPGRRAAAPSLVLRDMAIGGLEMVDTENLRPHYARTLWAWSDALEARLDEARAVLEKTHRRAGARHGAARLPPVPRPAAR